ncbi:MAG: alkaline phosphatase family protein [Sporocytophaga sp.]|uniref:alkaline phosphatase family protein n=1 Tax=Sporocytophaga sp. TaxID=2231183 RepID=UPI001B29FCC7|nr:alkaline phosphatase family protein [Sporocytophaga sp.]MBO9701182.1 alkaline phosphatase family protein [Sporocytophaga sp.]
MRKFYFVLLFFCLSISSVFSQKRIVFIGVDGLGSRILNKADTPVWDSLASQGSYSYNVNAVLPTLSNPNWASLLMGVSTSDHQIWDNKWRKSDFEERTFCNQEKGNTVPTIFKVMRERYPEGNIAVFHEWKEFTELIELNTLTYSFYEKGSGLILKASDYIVKEKPLFTFIHLDIVDKAGHTFGYRSIQYKTAVEKADSLTGVIIKRLKAGNALDSTIFIITSDHGFNGKGHGGRSKKLREVPLIIAGAGIQVGFRLPDGLHNYDLPVTLASILNCTIPDCWKGEMIKELLESSEHKTKLQ